MPVVRVFNKTSSEIIISGLHGFIVPTGNDKIQEFRTDVVDHAIKELDYLQDIGYIVYTIVPSENDYCCSTGTGGGVVYMTTAERLADGGTNSLVFDTDLQTLFVWDPVISNWVVTGSGGGVIVEDEGAVIGTAQYLNIVGSAHNAVFMGGGVVNIYSPPNSYSPFYNTGTATVADIGVGRLVADPAPDNTYSITGWVAGSTNPVLSSTNPIWDTVALCSIFDNSTTTLSATVFAADGVTSLASRTLTIVGPNDDTVNGIRLRITDWQGEGIKFVGRVRVSPDLSTVLPLGGKYTLVITHDDKADGIYTKTQTLFYDICPQAATITGISVVENIPSLKYLSGIAYYDLGSSFDIGISDMDFLNSDSYPLIQADFDGETFYGMGNSVTSLSGNDLLGWSPLHLLTGVSYLATHNITKTDFRYINTGAFISANVYDWLIPDDSDVSPNAAVAIDTHSPDSDWLSEYFTDEVYRRTSTLVAWDSTQHLTAYDTNQGLLVQGGILKTARDNWIPYSPLNAAIGSNPNYTAVAGNEDYYREFRDVTSSVRTNATLTITGFNLTDLINGDIKIWLDIPGRFITPCYLHGPLTYNNATFSGNNDPIREASSTANVIYVSFGTLGLDSTHNVIQMHIEINSAFVALQPSSIVLSW